MAINKKPTVEEFLSDPKYADEKNFMRGVFDGLAAEKQTADDVETAKKPAKESLFSGLDLFGVGDK